jgi:hypothetical protein
MSTLSLTRDLANKSSSPIGLLITTRLSFPAILLGALPDNNMLPLDGRASGTSYLQALLGQISLAESTGCEQFHPDYY